jgi:hypothetical protein
MGEDGARERRSCCKTMPIANLTDTYLGRFCGLATGQNALYIHRHVNMYVHTIDTGIGIGMKAEPEVYSSAAQPFPQNL